MANGNELMRMWDAMLPMANAAIEKQTRDAPRMKQMVVMEAYNATTKTVGVCEPFGKTVQLPVYGGLDVSKLVPKTAVWVLSPYSSFSNAMVFMLGDGSVGDIGARISALESAVSGMWNTIYPVGSLYISTNSTSPASLFGGTWEQIEDTFLIAAGQSYTAGDTGGSETHTHTTGEHALTTDELPSHRHEGLFWTGGSSANLEAKSDSGTTYRRVISTNGEGGGSNHYYTGYSGSGAAHSHGDTGSASSLPPYLAVYVWKRTA